MAYDGDCFGSGTRNVIYEEDKIITFKFNNNFGNKLTDSTKSNLLVVPNGELTTTFIGNFIGNSFSFYKNNVHFDKFNRFNNFIENIFNKENIINKISIIKDRFIRNDKFKF
jgi:hypothetical protein